MDFSYDEDQQAIISLASQIFRDKASHERQRQIEQGTGPRFDRALWAALAKAGLLGLAVPEEHGGAGFGFLTVAAVLEQAGRCTAPVPLLETLVLGALPIARFGSAAQQAAWLPKLGEGSCVLTAALMDESPDPEAPTVRAQLDGAAATLHGTKICVPAAQLADRIVVSASLASSEVGLFLLDPRGIGVTVKPVVTTAGTPEAVVELQAAPAEVLARPREGREALAWLLDRAWAAQSAVALGVCEAALAMTAEYTKTRKQFDQPIAMFQAVGHRAADAYVDVEAIRLTALQAAWRLDAGLPARAQVALAKFWAAEAGQRVVHAAQHLHGGIGVDRDYPLHRFFTHAKQLELALGGATPQLLRIGRLLADAPV